MAETLRQVWHEAGESKATRRRRVYDFIRMHQTISGYPPTYEEIAQGLDLAQTVVWWHIQVLVREGKLVHVQKGSARGYRLPLAVSAGGRILAVV